MKEKLHKIIKIPENLVSHVLNDADVIGITENMLSEYFTQIMIAILEDDSTNESERLEFCEYLKALSIKGIGEFISKISTCFSNGQNDSYEFVKFNVNQVF